MKNGSHIKAGQNLRKYNNLSSGEDAVARNKLLTGRRRITQRGGVFPTHAIAHYGGNALFARVRKKAIRDIGTSKAVYRYDYLTGHQFCVFSESSRKITWYFLIKWHLSDVM